MSAIANLAAVLAFSAALPMGAEGPPGAMSEAGRAAIERAVLETHALSVKAAQSLDADKLFSFMLDNDKGSVIQNGRILLTREQALAQVRSNFRGIKAMEYRWKQQHVTVVSPTVAILVTEGESAVTTEQGDSFVAPFAQSSVFVQVEGQWKILHSHQSSPPRR